ncbi:MAG: DUF420 domain-containing protein [Bacteroidetes bacterium]|nr:DUF420 domain-containing protein [Bacteroidota bacterium]
MKDKLVFRIIMVVSIIVFIAVIILNKKILPVPEVIPDFVYKLPKLNAMLNGTCALLLLLSLYMIRQGNIAMHKKLNIIAFVLSAVFLVSYITYHWMAQETIYPKELSSRTTYLIILISHIILAALVLPLVLLSFYYGLRTQQADGDLYIKKHRKITRLSFPIWLYVTITGVVVYLMISPFYTH